MSEEQVVDGQQAPAGDSNSQQQTPPNGAQNTQQSNSQQRPAGSNGAADNTRDAGILADLQKERRARQALETERATMRAELDAERRRVQALAGVNPRSDEETEADAIRQRFAKVFPGLAKLSDAQIDKLLATAERGDSMDEAMQHHWQTHARGQLSTLTTELADAIGGELTPRQATAIKKAFTSEAEGDPAFLARYEAGDPTLIKEFVRQWVEDWYEPARRQVTADTVQRQRRVPNGRDRSFQPAGGQKKINFGDPKAVEDAMVEAFKSHGGGFGD